MGFFPALESKTNHHLPSSHSYRTGGPASSRREMSSSRIIDMINEPVKEISEGPGQKDLSADSEYYSQPKTPSEPSE